MKVNSEADDDIRLKPTIERWRDVCASSALGVTPKVVKRVTGHGLTETQVELFREVITSGNVR